MSKATKKLPQKRLSCSILDIVAEVLAEIDAEAKKTAGKAVTHG